MLGDVSARDTEIARELFAAPGAALLAAEGCTRMAASRLPAAHEQVFATLGSRLRRSYAERDPELARAAYGGWHHESGQVGLTLENEPHPVSAAYSAAIVQFACLLPVLPPRPLPADSFYDITPEDFAAIARKAAKRSDTALKALRLRLRRLLTRRDEPWSQQCEAADRMSWGRPFRSAEFSARTAPLALELAAGAPWQWQELHGQRLFRVQTPDGWLAARVDEHEERALRGLCAEQEPSA